MSMSEERRGMMLNGKFVWVTLTELQQELSGTPTKHVLSMWDLGKRE